MRDLLRKDITEADIIRATELLVEKEIPSLRLYFMVGLPKEEEQELMPSLSLPEKFNITLCIIFRAKKVPAHYAEYYQFIPNRQLLAVVRSGQCQYHRKKN